jgi:hypothetical protein
VKLEDIGRMGIADRFFVLFASTDYKLHHVVALIHILFSSSPTAMEGSDEKQSFGRIHTDHRCTSVHVNSQKRGRHDIEVNQVS